MAFSLFITSWEIFQQLNGWHIGIVWDEYAGEYDWAKKYSLHAGLFVKRRENTKPTLLFYTSGFV